MISAEAIGSFAKGDEFRAARDFHRAAKWYARGLRAAPDVPEAVLNYANLLLTIRRPGEALHVLESALRVHHSYPLAANYLTTSLYTPDVSAGQIAARHLHWGTGYPKTTLPRPRSTRRRIRIGYLSANFCASPEIFFTLPILRNHDRDRFEIYVYSSSPKHDEQSEYIKSIANCWRFLFGIDDDEALTLIRRDRLDILVDFSGHFANGRLPLLARRAAPVQVSFPTWPATTGSPNVDFRLCDAFTDPPRQTSHLHSERLVRLPRTYCCYLPPESPAASALPGACNGYVTFGVFNRPHKITDRFLAVCGNILRKLPHSRIVFHHSYNGPGKVSRDYRKPMLDILAVDPDRVDFIGALPLKDRLACIARVDIALDTFPYNGMTTTCECLWMGVPVMTLEGSAHASRVGVSLLNSVNLPDWIAATEDDYITKAVHHARQTKVLSTLRQHLRNRMQHSPLTQSARYVRALESAYKRMLNS